MLRHVSFFSDRFADANFILCYIEVTVPTKCFLKHYLDQRKQCLSKYQTSNWKL